MYGDTCKFVGFFKTKSISTIKIGNMTLFFFLQINVSMLMLCNSIFVYPTYNSSTLVDQSASKSRPETYSII